MSLLRDIKVISRDKSHSKNTGLETHEKVQLYGFVHVFFDGMCTVLCQGIWEN